MPRQIIPDICRYHAYSHQLLVPFDYQCTVFPKLLAYKTSSCVFILHRRNVVHIIISSIMCHAILYEIFADITLNLAYFDYQYTVFPKFWHFKRVAVYLFYTGRNVYQASSATPVYTRCLQISRLISSATCTF